MALYSSLHFFFSVLDSILEFQNATSQFHDAKFEFLFSNSSSHFIFSVHYSTLEFHKATSQFQNSTELPSRRTFSVQRTSLTHVTQVPLSTFDIRMNGSPFQRKPAVFMRTQINMAETKREYRENAMESHLRQKSLRAQIFLEI